MKRIYGDRPGWTRIINKQYAHSFIENEAFIGDITLLHLKTVAKPLVVAYGDRTLTIVDNGYYWLQQFPQGKHHAVTTMLDANRQLIQQYIDICSQTGIVAGVPYMDDLFLDIIVFPDGTVVEKDREELEEALELGLIDISLYEIALHECASLTEQIKNGL